MRAPNILFVFSDQHRWCDLGCYGNADVHTPRFDAFAAAGAQIGQCVSNSPLCVPARGNLLTGQFPLRHGAVSNDLPIRTDVISIADVLGYAGYRTGYIGKWHLAGVPREQVVPAGRARLGFQEWKVRNCSHTYFGTHYHDEMDRRHDVPGYEPVAQTDLAIDFIRRHPSVPWGLVLSWGPPHDPYGEAPEPQLARYRNAPLRVRRNVPELIHDRRDRTLPRAEALQNLRGYAPLPQNAEMSAELATQKQITAELRAIQTTMSATQKNAEQKFGELVNQTADTIRLRNELEAERARVKQLEVTLREQANEVPATTGTSLAADTKW